MTRLTCEEVRELLPLLALDVLDVDEVDVLEDHLSDCPACRAELASHAETAAALALALPQGEPSAGLKGRVLADASRARLVPGGGAGRERPTRRMLGAGRFRLPISVSGVVAAVALLMAAGSTAWALSLRSEITAQEARIATLTERAQNYMRVTAVLQAADTQIRVLSGTSDAPEAFGRVYIDPETNEGMLMVRNLPPLPKGRNYQLWVAGTDGTRQSAGVLTWTDTAGNGYTFIRCPEKLSRWQSFGVTMEPAGGSPAPTGSRMLGGAI